ncbi:hypothetical protein Mevan_1646 [Methanococcus vannielii SB]|uniref:Uncharacterized protein n=1 Tax=Methanococcus vannielii (strain ATCC 35089 / DSM 1224 / JCM 13029 / OCM 148 / SB) TaxID=406327 RepID=A6USR6_METVS|nr:hypothetical protein [Methanococcus vannielii]ABR55538.1 hypothetical protein Mevan_1646 [Methanococcus vannielii SB]
MRSISQVQKDVLIKEAQKELAEKSAKRIELIEKVWDLSEKYAAEKKVVDNIFIFDLDEFSEKYELKKEHILEVFPKGSDLTSIYHRVYKTLKIPGVKVEFKGLEGTVEISERSLFKEICEESRNLEFNEIKNLYAIEYLIRDEGDRIKDSKAIAAYTKPKIENVTYFNGRTFETQKKLIIKDNEIDLNDEISYFDNFITAVKPSGNFNYIKFLNEYGRIYDYIIKRYDDTKKVIKRTVAYGYYGKDKIILNGWELQKESLRARDFKKMLSMKYKRDEIKDTLELLKEYFGAEDFTKIIFEYSLSSLFRYDLLNKETGKTKRLDKFPYLLIIGKQGIGKTARMNIVFNKLLLNTTDTYSNDDLKGSIAKLAKEQYVNLPMWFDELKEFPERLVDILKQIGTKDEAIITRGNKETEKEDYNFLLRRPFIISTNQFREFDPALVDRFIVLSAYDYDLVNNEQIGNKLLDKMPLLGAYIYKNIEKIKEHVDTLEFDSSRENANDNVIMIGREIAKFIFKEFELEYEPSKTIVYGNSNIYTSKDSVKKSVIKEVLKLSEWVESGIKYNILDYIAEPEGANYFVGVKQLEKYGIYIKKDKIENYHIVLTAKGLNFIELGDTGIKTLSEFNAHGFEVKATRVLGTKKPQKAVWIPITEEFTEHPDDQIISEIIVDTMKEFQEEKDHVHEAEITLKLELAHGIPKEKSLELLENMVGKIVVKPKEYLYKLIERPIQEKLE